MLEKNDELQEVMKDKKLESNEVAYGNCKYGKTMVNQRDGNTAFRDNFFKGSAQEKDVAVGNSQSN